MTVRIDWALIPGSAFAAQHKDSVFYDQVSGKELKAWVEQGQLRQIDVNGNAQTDFLSSGTGLDIDRAE